MAACGLARWKISIILIFSSGASRKRPFIHLPSLTVSNLSSGKVVSSSPLKRTSWGTLSECNCKAMGPSPTFDGSGIAPVEDEFAIDDEPDAIALRENFHVVPAVPALLAAFLSAARTSFGQTRPLRGGTGHRGPIRTGTSPADLDRCARLLRRGVLDSHRHEFLAPQSDAGMRFREVDLRAEDQAEIAEIAFGEKISLNTSAGPGVLADDDAVLDRPEILVAFPAVKVLAVEKLDGFGFALRGGISGAGPAFFFSLPALPMPMLVRRMTLTPMSSKLPSCQRLMSRYLQDGEYMCAGYHTNRRKTR